MRKNIILSCICLITVLLLAGCSKTKIDSDRFKSVLEEKGFTVENQSNGNISYDINELYVANKGDDYIVEYFSFKDKDYAKKTFDSRVDNYNNISVKKSRSTTTYGNYEKVAIVADGRFYYIARIDNTIVLALTSENYKKDAEEIINTLGY